LSKQDRRENRRYEPVGDTEGGGDLGREVDVAGRVNQVDQEGVAWKEGTGVEQSASESLVRGMGEEHEGDAPTVFCLTISTSSSGSSK
jgi:hypothetical protein